MGCVGSAPFARPISSTKLEVLSTDVTVTFPRLSVTLLISVPSDGSRIDDLVNTINTKNIFLFPARSHRHTRSGNSFSPSRRLHRGPRSHRLRALSLIDERHDGCKRRRRLSLGSEPVRANQKMTSCFCASYRLLFKGPLSPPPELPWSPLDLGIDSPWSCATRVPTGLLITDIVQSRGTAAAATQSATTCCPVSAD